MQWFTEEMTAKRGSDFVEENGTVIFESGEQEKTIAITIIQSAEKEPDEHFKVHLGEVSEGAKIGDTKATIVTIIGDEEFKNMVNRVAAKTHIALTKDCLHLHEYHWLRPWTR